MPAAQQPATAPAPPHVSIEQRLAVLEQSFTDFKSRVEVVIQFSKWAAGTATVTLITVIFSVIGIANTAGQLQSDLRHQGTEIQATREEVKALRETIDKLAREVAELRVRLEVKGK